MSSLVRLPPDGSAIVNYLSDDVTEATRLRDYVTGAISGPNGDSTRASLERHRAELHTTQRYPLYRALQYPLRLALGRFGRVAEGIDNVRAAATLGRVVYASNHRSHVDYLIEPLLLEENGVRPPVIAAGINLFGGPLGLLHRHVTGAIPIRRNTKDPAYLLALRAHVAQVLGRQDLLFYPEGGRSYSGGMKPPKTGIFLAVVEAGQPRLTVIPTAISYDLTLEDRVLARQGVKRSQRPFHRELAELLSGTMGYRSRAYVTFGEPLPIPSADLASRSAVLDFAHVVMGKIGRLYKVLPSAVVASAMRPSMGFAELEYRCDSVIERVGNLGANMGVSSGAEAVALAIEPLEARGVITLISGCVRVRNRNLLRYYARSLNHLIYSSMKLA